MTRHTQTHPDTPEHKGERGNVKSLSHKRRAWMITINSLEGDTEADFLKHTKHTITSITRKHKHVFQFEKGTENERLHCHCYIYFYNAVNFKWLKDTFTNGQIEQVRSIPNAIKYCSKDETRVDGPYCFGITLPKKLKLIEELRDFQQDIIDEIDFDDDRTINWYWDTDGGIGKTALAKYICTKYNAIYLGGKANDCKYAVSQWKNKDDLIVIFGFPREAENYVSYRALEEIKDGIFFCNKYESEMVIMNSPHIIVLANFEPDTETLSKDRWNIRQL